MAGKDSRLVGIAGPLKGTTFPLRPGEFSIGREATNQFWISDPALSRRHCLITGSGDQFIIRDLQSRNGTFVNGTQIEILELHRDDQISVGASTLIFLESDGAARPETNTVKLTETAELGRPSVRLRQEDALYLQPGKIATALPQTERATRDLNFLLRVAIGIGGIRDGEALQWQLLGLIFDVVPAERGAVLFCDSSEVVNSVAAWDRVRGPGHPVHVSRTVLHHVLQEGTGLLVGDVAAEQGLPRAQTLSESNVKSLLGVPLMVSGKALGAIYLDSSLNTFDEGHLQVMTALAAIVSLALANIRHWEELQQENRDLRAEINLEHNMVGTSPRMREVFEFVRRVAPTDSTVLIHGESGTGKELVARALHRNSTRAAQPFVAINCATLSDTLLESELFGHEKGAFTGAFVQKKGKLEIADGGTLFLDEVSETAPMLQAKLLRVLQEREFERVGGTKPIKVDLRLITATNKSLPEAVEAGSFRGDLYYRLNVVALTLPSLRERREDIPALAKHFIAKASRKCKTRPKPISADAQECLKNYDWPGNVRELENAIERALVLGSGDSIDPEDLPETILEGSPVSTSSDQYLGAIKEMKKQLVSRALQQYNNNYIEAAKGLGMHPNSLLRLIRNLGLKAAAKAGQRAHGIE